MKTVTLIVGLPGSGKSYLGGALAKDKGLLLDDPKDKQQLIFYLNKCDFVVVCDPWFCMEKQRLACVNLLKKLYPGIVINFIYFENDLEACKINLQRRKDEGDARVIEKDLLLFHKHYSVPLEVETKSVYKE